MSIEGNITWNDSLEKYFADTAEKCHCLGWVHKRSEEIYSNRRTLIDLPVIVVSAVTGFLSAGSTTLFDDAKISSVALGVASLLVSSLTTIGTYFNWAKRAEGHRLSSIQYAKLYRFLSVELSLPRDERMSPSDLLKYTKENYDRLQELSPLIPPAVIEDFRRRFEKEKEIAKPEDLNGLEKVVVFHENPLRQVESTHTIPPSPGLTLERPPLTLSETRTHDTSPSLSS
jgi:hypothetical protein